MGRPRSGSTPGSATSGGAGENSAEQQGGAGDPPRRERPAVRPAARQGRRARGRTARDPRPVGSAGGPAGENDTALSSVQSRDPENRRRERVAREGWRMRHIEWFLAGAILLGGCGGDP